MAQALRDRYLQRIVDLIDQGRADMDDPEALGRGVAEGVCGAIYSFLIHELQKDAAGIRTPEEFVPDLMYIAVRPYLGHAAAQEELDG